MKIKILTIIGILALVNIPLANAATPGAPPSLIEPPSLNLGDDFFGDSNPPPSYQCADGVDNDQDGKTDFGSLASNDPGCSSASDNSETDPPPLYQCSDTIDNDLDGKTDYPTDPGCSSASDTDETDPQQAPTYACSNNIDDDGDGKKDYPQDPGCANGLDNNETDPAPEDESDAIEIVSASVYPKGMNPLVNEAKITYELSAAATIELKIIDSSGRTMVKLVDNEEVDGDQEYFVWWNGTDSTAEGGKTVLPGKYFFKLTAKTADEKVADVADGSINIIYATDFEEPPLPGPGGPGPVTTDPINVLNLHNNPPTTTSGTGPEMFVYLGFPVIGYFISRKKRK